MAEHRGGVIEPLWPICDFVLAFLANQSRCVGYRTELALVQTQHPRGRSQRGQRVNRFKVVATNKTSAIVAIEDEAGQCHLGRALDVVPDEGEILRGATPAFGLLPLRDAETERPCPVVLVMLNCEPEVAKQVVTVPHPD